MIRRVTRTGRPTVVTNRGEPVAAVVPVDPEALEDFVLANAPSFVRAMSEADEALRDGRTRDSAEVFAELREVPATPSVSPLTDREREILGLVAGGYSSAEIARALNVSPRTVKANFVRIFGKLAASEQAKAPASRKR